MQESVNQAIEKISPFKALSNEQKQLKETVEKFIIANLHAEQHAVFTIRGDAGTGKSVVLSQLFNNLQTAAANENSPLYHTKNIFLVNHPELLKVYQSIAGELPHMLKKNFDRPTTFINRAAKKDEHYDVAVIDEAHLLLSRPDRYNNFDQDNQLIEIIKRAQVVVLVFDEYQVLKTKSFWNRERLQKIVDQYIHAEYDLHRQFRMQASPEIVDWINAFIRGKIKPMPQSTSGNFDFRIMADAEKMYQLIRQHDREDGLSRIVSTTGYPSTLDGGKHYIDEGKFHLPWDQYNYSKIPWAEKPETINEVGSIYTVQGFDLNYVGVILGPPIEYVPETDAVTVNLNKVTDVEIFKKRPDITDPATIVQLKKQLIMNTLNVLFKRGVHGLYIYASQPELRARLTENKL